MPTIYLSPCELKACRGRLHHFLGGPTAPRLKEESVFTSPFHLFSFVNQFSWKCSKQDLHCSASIASTQVGVEPFDRLNLRGSRTKVLKKIVCNMIRDGIINATFIVNWVIR